METPGTDEIVTTNNGKRPRRKAGSTTRTTPLSLAPLELTVDFEGLSIGDLEALEESTRTHEIIEWLVKHAQADAAGLRKRPLLELREIMERVGSEIREALKVPKARARN